MLLRKLKMNKNDYDKIFENMCKFLANSIKNPLFYNKPYPKELNYSVKFIKNNNDSYELKEISKID